MSNNEKIHRLVELEFSDLDEEEDVTPEVQARVEEYRDSLEGLSATELDLRIEAAEASALRDLRQLYRTLQDEHRAQQERRRFFHRQHANADFSAWSLMRRWTLDQTTALVLGKEPTVVTRERLLRVIDESPFATHYEKVRAFLSAAGLEFPI